eukprot:2152-Heterococcus_DN1.PRE.4
MKHTSLLYTTSLDTTLLLLTCLCASVSNIFYTCMLRTQRDSLARAVTQSPVALAACLCCCEASARGQSADSRDHQGDIRLVYIRAWQCNERIEGACTQYVTSYINSSSYEQRAL